MSRVLVIAAALALAACRDARLEQLQAIRDEVCACKTAACGEETMKRVPKPRDGASSDHRTQKIARSMMECLAKLYASEQPSTDPDAEAPEPGATDPATPDP